MNPQPFRLVDRRPAPGVMTGAAIFGGGAMFVREGHPALGDRLLVELADGTSRSFDGRFAAAAAGPAGVARVSSAGEVVVLGPGGAVAWQLAPPSGFSQRYGAAAAFTARGELVLVGGCDSAGLRDDAWACTPAGWRPLAAAPPAQMRGQLLALADGGLLLAGGFRSYPTSGCDWAAIFNGSQWRTFAAPRWKVSPGELVAQVLLQDPTSRQVLLARASFVPCGERGADAQVWALRSGGAWSGPVRVRFEEQVPCWEGLALAFDASRRALVAFGKRAAARARGATRPTSRRCCSPCGRRLRPGAKRFASGPSLRCPSPPAAPTTCGASTAPARPFCSSR